jgi:hypothetical protein
MYDGEDEDDVGEKLTRIRSEQSCGQDSTNESSDDDNDAPMIHLLQQQSQLSQWQSQSQSQSQSVATLFSQDCPLTMMPPLSCPPPSLPPSRPPSLPPSRAPSPAVSALGTKKKAAVPKKTAEEIAEAQKLQSDIDTVVNSFKPEYRDYIVCEDEHDAKNSEDKEFYNVARWLKVNKPTPRRLDLSLFNSKQIRKLAQNCGVKGGGNLTLFQARKKIALSINMGTVYNDDTIANPKTSFAERKVNTLMRITNACFHPEMKDRFIDLNDTKKRAHYEAAHGGNPIKDFWVQVSELTNDSSRNDVLGVVLEARQGEDDRLYDFVANGTFNLNDWTLQTFLSCQQNMNDCMKAREACLRAMRLSGHHSNDLYTYCTNVTFTKLRKSSAPVPAAAVYYCHVLCEKNPDIDGKFAAFLSEKLKSDSDIDLTGEAGVSQDGGNNKRKGIAIDSLVQTLSSATTEFAKVFADKKQSTHDADRGEWNEYFAVSEKFLEMKDQPNKLPLMCIMSIRLRMLEKTLGITSEQSVTNGIQGIPPIGDIVTVDRATRDNCESDITSR